jgi:phosphatidylglycerophosphate synthase
MLDGWTSRLARALPTTLSLLRLVLGPAFVLALEMSATLPLVVALLAATSDFVDGRLARRLGVSSTRGAVLDVVGDGVFVLSALAALAAGRYLSWLLPAATALALTGLALAAWRRRAAAPAAPGAERPRRGPADRAGHAAGIANYATVIAGSVVVAGWVAGPWLVPVSVAVAVLNLAPLLLRLAHGR